MTMNLTDEYGVVVSVGDSASFIYIYIETISHITMDAHGLNLNA